MGKVSRHQVQQSPAHTRINRNKTKRKHWPFNRTRKVSDIEVRETLSSTIDSNCKTSSHSILDRICRRCDNGIDWIKIGFLTLVKGCYSTFTHNQEAIAELELDIAGLRNNIRERNGEEKITRANKPVWERARRGDLVGAGKNFRDNVKDKVSGTAEIATAKFGKFIAGKDD